MPGGVTRTLPTVPHFSNEPVAEAVVHNASALPVYDVTLEVRTRSDPVTFHMVPPHEQCSVDLPSTYVGSVEGRSLGVRFRDAAGVRWLRHVDGRLEELEDSSSESETAD